MSDISNDIMTGIAINRFQLVTTILFVLYWPMTW